MSILVGAREIDPVRTLEERPSPHIEVFEIVQTLCGLSYRNMRALSRTLGQTQALMEVVRTERLLYAREQDKPSARQDENWCVVFTRTVGGLHIRVKCGSWKLGHVGILVKFVRTVTQEAPASRSSYVCRGIGSQI